MVKKAGLAFTSGHIFGAEGAGFMRLNAAAPRATIATALQQLEEAVMFPRV